MCAHGFKFLRTFVMIFEMYEFSAATFIKVLSYQSFEAKCLLISLDACVYIHMREWLRVYTYA